jgi:hypothetical protein
LDSKQITFYLEKLSEVLANKQIKGEIVLYGGAVMVTAFNARPSTKDVDAIFSPKEEIYAAAKEIEGRYDIPEDWLNDAVKGFISTQEEVEPFLDFPYLKVYVAKPQYMLAMKCMSLRLGRGEKDLEDIQFLIRHLGIKTAEELLNLVKKYYPRNRISPKTQFAIEELFETFNK